MSKDEVISFTCPKCEYHMFAAQFDCQICCGSCGYKFIPASGNDVAFVSFKSIPERILRDPDKFLDKPSSKAPHPVSPPPVVPHKSSLPLARKKAPRPAYPTPVVAHKRRLTLVRKNAPVPSYTPISHKKVDFLPIWIVLFSFLVLSVLYALVESEETTREGGTGELRPDSSLNLTREERIELLVEEYAAEEAVQVVRENIAKLRAKGIFVGEKEGDTLYRRILDSARYKYRNVLASMSIVNDLADKENLTGEKRKTVCSGAVRKISGYPPVQHKLIDER